MLAWVRWTTPKIITKIVQFSIHNRDTLNLPAHRKIKRDSNAFSGFMATWFLTTSDAHYQRKRRLTALDDPRLSIIKIWTVTRMILVTAGEWRAPSYYVAVCVAGKIQSPTELRSLSRLATHLCFHPSLLVWIIPLTIFSIFLNLFWIILSSSLSCRSDFSAYKYWSQILLWDPCFV